MLYHKLGLFFIFQLKIEEKQIFTKRKEVYNFPKWEKEMISPYSCDYQWLLRTPQEPEWTGAQDPWEGDLPQDPWLPDQELPWWLDQERRRFSSSIKSSMERAWLEPWESPQDPRENPWDDPWLPDQERRRFSSSVKSSMERAWRRPQEDAPQGEEPTRDKPPPSWRPHPLPLHRPTPDSSADWSSMAQATPKRQAKTIWFKIKKLKNWIS